MRILVTGCTGFVGGHLLEALRQRHDAELIGLSRRSRWPEPLAHLADHVTLIACDLIQSQTVAAALAETCPDQVYHLAGYPHVGRSFQEAHTAWDNNLIATLNLLEAACRLDPMPRILHVSSGLVYGNPSTADQVFDETAPLRPTSPYAASKAAADLTAYQYSQAPGLPIVRARPFNHTGPRQSPEFAVPAFAKQMAAIQLGQSPPRLLTGDLRPQRDLTDVRDIVQAYLLLMDKGRTGEAYNVSSGNVYSMASVVDRLQTLAGFQVEVDTQAERVRKVEMAVVRGNADKLRNETGWKPRYPVEQTLDATLGYWKSELGCRRF